jgi:hypothetical protein
LEFANSFVLLHDFSNQIKSSCLFEIFSFY